MMPVVPLSHWSCPLKGWDNWDAFGTLGKSFLVLSSCSANKQGGLSSYRYVQLLFHGLSSFLCPGKQLRLPCFSCCPMSHLSHLSHCPKFSWDGTAGHLGTAAFSPSLLRWIIRLTGGFGRNLPVRAISGLTSRLGQLQDIWVVPLVDSLSSFSFRCSFSVE